MKSPSKLATCIWALLLPQFAIATTVTWDGGAGTSLWSDTDNWNPNGLPGTDADLQFTGSTPVSINLNGNRKAKSLLFSGATGYTLSNNTLELTATTATITASGGTHTISSNVTLGSSAVFDVTSGTLALDGTVGATTGDTSLTKTGAGTLRIGNTASFLNGVTVSAGTLQIGTGGSSGSIGGNISNSGTVVFNRVTITYSGVISGGGALTISGNSAILSGDNTLTGTTTINSSVILQLGNNGTAGSVAGDIINNGTLFFSRSNALTYSKNISGSGTVTKSGAGTLTLTGTNSYNGNTTVSAGTLEIGLSGTLPATTVSVSSGATLLFNRTSDTTYGGVINGAGATTIAGGTNVTLTGTNGQTGALTINSGGGLLTVGNGATSGSISNASVVNNSSISFDRSDTVTFSGSISGNAFSQAGSGTLILTGDNTAEAFVEGGILQIGSGGTSGSVSGNIQVSSGKTLIFNRSNDITYGGALSQNGAVTKQGAGTLTLTGTSTGLGTLTISTGGVSIGNGGTTGTWAGNIANSGTLTFNRSDTITYSGAISGSGSLTQSGAGTLVLTGTNSPAATTVSAGTLQIGNSGTTGSISGNIANSGNVTFKRSDAITYADSISGNGSLTQAGTSALILTGSNTYNGGTTISSGFLSIGLYGTIGSITGDVVNNGSLYFTRTDNTTFAGNISGTGNVIKDDTAGTLTLTGTNNYSGGTRIFRGTLQLGDGVTNGTITGDVVNDGTLTFRRITSSYDFNGNISGNGNVIQNSTQTVRLGGTNTFAGGITITGGTLTIGTGSTGGSITSDVVNGSTLIFNRTADYTYSGKISGGGSVYKVNNNTLTLNGTNTYTNQTHLAGGLLNFTSLSNLGSNSQLTFEGGGLQWATGTTTDISTRTVFIDSGGGTLDTNGNNVTLANAIGNSGTGALTKSGAGTLTLGGSNTYSGTTNVSAGTLLVNGSISGSVSVSSGATLGGSGGTVGAVTVSGGGIVAPGASIGTLNTGAFSLNSTSILKFELATPGIVGGTTNDLLSVTGALTLDGTLQITQLSGFGNGTYRLFTYTGALTNNGLDLEASFLLARPGSSINTATAGQVNLIVAIPEPGAMISLLGGITCLLGLRRLRQPHALKQAAARSGDAARGCRDRSVA